MLKNKRYFLLISLLIIGTLFQLIAVWNSGRKCNLGVCFWGPNGHDGVWHVSLIKQTKKNIPPQNPVYSGETLRSYHWGYNLVAGLVSYLPLSVWSIHFRLLPLLFSLSLGIASFFLAKETTQKFWAGLWFAFLNYFSSSLGWVITLFRSGQLSGESLFWSMQANSFLLNPPFALSILVMLGGFYLWHQWRNNLNLFKMISLIFLFSVLINIKAYAGILFLVVLLSVNVLKLIKKKFNFKHWLIWLISFLLMLAYVLFFQRGSEFPFIFKPFWFIRTMFEASDRLYIPRLGRMWWAYVGQGILTPKLWILAGLGSAIFLIGNLGTRLLGWWQAKKALFNHNFFELVFVGFILFGVAIPLFWVQKGTTWNTIQFFYYAVIFSNYFLAKYLANLQLRFKQGWFYSLLIIFPLLPSNVGYLKTYLNSTPHAYVPKTELKALAFLSQQSGKVVLTYPYDESHSKQSGPVKLRNYNTTAYVSAFTGKQSFLEDEMNLIITGYDWEERKKESINFFQTNDKIGARGFLLNNEIDYIYLAEEQKFSLTPEDMGLRQIYNQQEVKIYQVLK